MHITITARQLREALEFCNPDGPDVADQLDMEVTITEREAFVSSDGEPMPAGLYCHLTERPEEGCMPLFDIAAPYDPDADPTAGKPWPVGLDAGRVGTVTLSDGLGAKYGPKQIARELIATALGEAYHGNALYVARDIPVLTDEERWVICRWLDGSQCGTDHVELQHIANKIAADA